MMKANVGRFMILFKDIEHRMTCRRLAVLHDNKTIAVTVYDDLDHKSTSCKIGRFYGCRFLIKL